MIRWIYAFADVPHAEFDAAARFWTTVTGTRLSDRRGEHAEFASLVPQSGDPYLKIQAVGGAGGSHFDLQTDRVPELFQQATTLGATFVAEHPGWHVLCSPGGVLFCLVPWNGEATPPQPLVTPGGATSRVDRVRLDIKPSTYGVELEFWTKLTGWPVMATGVPDLHTLDVPAELPLGVSVQRLDGDLASLVHLDFSCSDVAATQTWHEELGSRTVAADERVVIMRDPAGVSYRLSSVIHSG